MNGDELKALRKGMALTQDGLAKELGVSRKTVNELEGGGAVDARTALAVQQLVSRYKRVRDVFRVDEFGPKVYAVIRYTEWEVDHPTALYWSNSQTMLYGLFSRRVEANRWCAALRRADNPRNTRKLIRERTAELSAPKGSEGDAM